MAADKPFGEWIGRRTEAQDVVTARLAESFRATLGAWLAPVGEEEAPLGLHWCLSPAIVPMDALGSDGHPALNRDLPPLPQPRRMWAGGSLELHAPLRVGDRVRRTSVIADIARKDGRSGELWFVTVLHEHHGPRGLVIAERQDIVYREAAKPGASFQRPVPDLPARPARSEWNLETPPTLLFRYSALTFNGHRIHYDLPYALSVEAYPGIVVHGPLQATLLLNLAAGEAGRIPARFSYRGVTPAIGGSPLRVCLGEGGRLWTEGADGTVLMEASATD